MRVDPSKSQYHEAPEARSEFNRVEIRRLRLLLRRIRFLENQVRENRASGNDSGGAQFAEWEVDALEFVLTEVGFLAVPEGSEEAEVASV